MNFRAWLRKGRLPGNDGTENFCPKQICSFNDGEKIKTATSVRGSGRDVNQPARPYPKVDSSRAVPLRAGCLWQIPKAIDTLNDKPGMIDNRILPLEAVPPVGQAEIATSPRATWLSYTRSFELASTLMQGWMFLASG
jgi:hypothetical protein